MKENSHLALEVEVVVMKMKRSKGKICPKAGRLIMILREVVRKILKEMIMIRGMTQIIQI